jgi:iron complex outermembrane receptor protein
MIIDGTFGWLGFSFVSLGEADPAVIATFPGGGGTAIANPCLDCRPLRSPEITATVGAAYTMPLSGGDWGTFTLRGDVQYQSDTHFTQNNIARSMQGEYYVLNARGTWVSPTEDWEVSLAGININDRLYKVSVLDFMDSLGGIQYGYARPREFSVSIKKRF